MPGLRIAPGNSALRLRLCKATHTRPGRLAEGEYLVRAPTWGWAQGDWSGVTVLLACGRFSGQSLSSWAGLVGAGPGTFPEARWVQRKLADLGG